MDMKGEDDEGAQCCRECLAVTDLLLGGWGQGLKRLLGISQAGGLEWEKGGGEVRLLDVRSAPRPCQ